MATTECKASYPQYWYLYLHWTKPSSVHNRFPKFSNKNKQQSKIIYQTEGNEDFSFTIIIQKELPQLPLQ